MLNFSKISKNDKNLFILFIVLRLLISIFSVFILSNYIQIGDLGRYINYSTFKPELNSTQITTLIFGLPSKLFSVFLVVVLTSLVTSILMVKILFLLVQDSKRLPVFLFVLLLPSISIWTSIPGKEALLCFVLLLIFKIWNFSEKLSWMKKLKLVILSLFILFFKPHYILGFIGFIAFQIKKLKFYPRQLIYFLIIILIWHNYDWILSLIETLNALSIELPRHFNVINSDTRTHLYFQADTDWIFSIPFGTLIAFWGPTFPEAIHSLKYSITFFESLIIFFFILGQFYRFVSVQGFVVRHKLLLKVLTVIILFLIANYPFGYFNPGSALRYRAAYLPFMFFFLELIFIRVQLKKIKPNL